MCIAQTLDFISCHDATRNTMTSLGNFLDPELIARSLSESSSLTLRKRRLPLEMMVWCIIGMALERKEPLHQIVNRLNIMLPGNRPFVIYPVLLYRLARGWETMPFVVSLRKLSDGHLFLQLYV